MPTPAADAYCLLEVHQALNREPASFSLSEDLARSLQPGCSERPGAREPPRLQEASALPWQVGEAPQDPFIRVLREEDQTGKEAWEGSRAPSASWRRGVPIALLSAGLTCSHQGPGRCLA